MDEISQYLDIPYTSFANPASAQSFDIVVPQNNSISLTDVQHHEATPPLICFVHGGAWRREDKSDHLGLAHALANFTHFPVAVPNYRLSPMEATKEKHLHHPEHAKDILSFLEFLREWEGPRRGAPLPYDPTKLFLMGHSCGAHILACIFFDMPGDQLVPSDWLSQSTKAIIASEGIYDIDFLLVKHPTYRSWFIEQAFGPRTSYEEVSPSKADLRTTSQHLQWLIIHSKNDQYLDADESKIMYDHLVKQYGDRAAKAVSKNMDDLHHEHNGMLEESKLFVTIVGNYMFRITSE